MTLGQHETRPSCSNFSQIGRNSQQKIAEAIMASDATHEEKMKHRSPTEERHVTIRSELWLALLKIAGQQIEPDTAEVIWTYGQIADLYGVYPDLPEEYQCVGREYFARAPETDVWINFGDLPEVTREALWAKHEGQLAFPAGLEDLFDEAVN